MKPNMSKGKKEYVCWFLFIGRRVSSPFSCILDKTIFVRRYDCSVMEASALVTEFGENSEDELI